MMYDTEKWRRVAENAIVDVPDWNRVPTAVRHELYHVHENGVCRKHRFGPKCGVDSETHT